MNIRSGLSILGLATALACGGGGGGSSSYTPPPPSGPPPNTVWVGGGGGYGGGTTAFNPSTLTVTAGTTVTFSWQGGTHTVTSYAYNGSPTFPGLPAGQSSGTYTYQFNTPGHYYYYCTYHGTLAAGGTSQAMGMAGEVVVN
ncbi:MAG TPA: hypothetical protein VFF76_02995 [Holophagaceae bacterium]|jgi:plastocyanin|nr:hypothetical protein [Holophagaceae bacterium]